MSKRKPIISIQNIVASVSLNQKIDLQKIVEKFPQTEYNPSVFPGLVFRLKKPKTATLIFGTGKMVCTGAKSEKKAAAQWRKSLKNFAAKASKSLRNQSLTSKTSLLPQNSAAKSTSKA
jgi:transcription initiation factor TFIID TATA-box-binding protein